jgi:hypothetical protein
MHRTLLLAIAAAAHVTVAAGQPAPPIRATQTVATTLPGVIAGLVHVRALADGRVLVNDLSRKRLIMFDASLKSFTTLADTAAGSNPYPVQRAGLVAYLGDSSLFVDPAAGVLTVIEPGGKFGRAMAPPNASVAMSLSGLTCVCGFDPLGRVFYSRRRAQPHVELPLVPADGANQPVITQVYADSGVIVRADFDARREDTLGTLRMPMLKMGMVSVQVRGLQTFTVFNPLPMTDEWTLLPDGTIAIVRAQDYHIDWIDARGAMTSSPKMPFAWKRITQEQKVALLDSARKAYADRALRNPPPPGMLTAPFVTVEPDEIGDYYPAVRPGQVKADRDGNVWILPSTVDRTDGGLLYDVVNRAGIVFERVTLPQGRNIVAFGPGGVIYTIHAPGPANIVLERLTVQR